MDASRRNFVLSGFGLLAAGCTQQMGLTSLLPSPAWPRSAAANGPAPPVSPTVAYEPPALIQPTDVPKALKIIARSQWTDRAPDRRHINPMAGVERITVHHTGWDPIHFDDLAATAEHLEKIRRFHVHDRHWADIGYHYVIDRAGRIWEARPLQYQGAHVKNHNEQNLGVMVLGNFDRQRPTDAQLSMLRETIVQFRGRHQVPVERIYTHQELNVTNCPGSRLQQNMVRLRRDGHLT